MEDDDLKTKPVPVIQIQKVKLRSVMLITILCRKHWIHINCQHHQVIINHHHHLTTKIALMSLIQKIIDENNNVKNNLISKRIFYINKNKNYGLIH